ncbi:MAG: hypothetical protein KDB23_01100 [Planctomycetales bacterium]|nr:hypothetical protein [Planctomycetales bacterium]
MLRRRLWAFTFIWLASVGKAAGADSVWTAAGSGDWNTSANWSAGIPNGSGATAIFGESAPTAAASIGLTSPVALSGLDIRSPYSLLFSGELLSFTSLDANVAGQMNLSEQSRALLTLPVAWDASKQLNLNLAAGSEVSFETLLDANAGSLVVSGGGTTVLGQANTSWNGAITASASTVDVFNDRGLGTTTLGTRIDSGGTLRLRGALTLPAEPITLSGSTIAAQPGSNNRTVANSPITLESGNNFITVTDASATLELRRAISGAGNLATRGVVELQTSTSHTGSTLVESGRLIVRRTNGLAATSSVSVAAGAELNTQVSLATNRFVLNGGRLSGNSEVSMLPINAPIEVNATGSVITTGLRLDQPISGAGQLTLQRNVIVNADNTYSGRTTIRQGLVTVNSVNGLGSTTAATQIVTGGQLNVAAPIVEPLELAGGTLNFEPGAVGFTSSIVSQGGKIMIERDGPALNNVSLSEGLTQITAESIAGATISGAGDLEYVGPSLTGANLQHAGSLTIRPTGQFVLDEPLQFAGDLIVNTGELTLANAASLADASRTVHALNTNLFVDAAIDRGFVVEDSRLWIMPSGQLTGPLVLRGSAELVSTVPISSPLQLEGDEAILRVAEINGAIHGSGRLYFSADSTLGTTASLNSDSDYTGPTGVGNGRLVVNAPQALGAVEVGTLVENGELILNATVNEPISVRATGHVEINAAQPRLPVYVVNFNTPSQYTDARVSLNVDSEFPGTTVVTGGQLDVNAQVTLERVQLRDEGRLEVSAGNQLTIQDELVMHSGKLNVAGTLQTGNGVVRKTTLSRATFQSLGQFDGHIVVEDGVLEVSGSSGLGSNVGATEVGPHGSLQLHGGLTIDDDILLDNALGRRHHDGGLQFTGFGSNDPTTLRGTLDLGTQGSRIVGTSSAQLHVDGPIVGGELEYDNIDNPSFLSIRGNQNSYTGATRLQGGYLAIAGDGSISTTSEIVIASNAVLALQNWDVNRPDRIGDNVPLTMMGGELRMESGAQQDHYTETMGRLRFAHHDSRISITGDPTASNRFTFSDLQRDRGAAAIFEVGGDQEIHFTAPPQLSNGLIGGWAVANFNNQGYRFATYGPNGIASTTSVVNSLTAATATDNVLLATATTMSRDVNVNSLQMENRQQLNLGNHLLTVESGGILTASTLGGRITAGANANQELILQFPGTIESSIIDNAQGAVDLIVVGGGYLKGSNEHHGVTRLLAGGGLNSFRLGSQSIPIGGNLEVDTVQLTTDGGLNVGNLQITGKSSLRVSGGLRFQTIDLAEGALDATYVGNGTLRKTSSADAYLFGSSSSFTGQVVVEDGTLYASTELRAAEITGGTLYYRTSDRQISVDVTLAGGTFEVEDTKVLGTLAVTAPSTIKSAGRSLTVNADLIGSAPLKFQGTGNSTISLLRPTNVPVSNFSGDVIVEHTTLFAQPDDLGTGVVHVLEDGTLHTSLNDRMTTEQLTLSNDIVLSGGRLRVETRFEAGILAGNLSVSGISQISLGTSDQQLILAGAVQLSDGSQLQLNGVGDINFAGPIVVDGAATIDAQVRQDSFILGPANIQLTGPITAASENSVLDLIAVGVNLNPNLNIPAGQSLQVRINGVSQTVELRSAAASVAGNGELQNDLAMSNGARLAPGASVGHLHIAGDLELGPGAVYEWELSDASNDGWDTVTVAGTVQGTATPDDPFVVKLVGLDALGGVGVPAVFDANHSRSWQILTADHVASIAPSSFLVDPTSLEAALAVPVERRWQVVAVADGLQLTYLLPSEIDTIVAAEDREAFVHDLAHTWFGDANFDGMFNSSDLVQVFVQGQYEDDIVGNSRWQDGDWNGDHEFTSSDLVAAFQDGGYEMGTRAAVVPEPQTFVLLVCGVGLCGYIRRTAH